MATTAAKVAAGASSSGASKVDVIQIDGLVVMKLIKHCHEVDSDAGPGGAGVGGAQGVAQGALLGLVADSRLEITHSFPFPSSAVDGDDSVDDEDFQLAMMRRLRMVNVDHLHVGWYQSAQFGNFLSPQLMESHFAYQTSIEESICLIFDTAKTRKGFLSMKAYRLTPEALALYKAGDFQPETVKNLKISHDNLFKEVPIVVKNSHLVNELLLELTEQIPGDASKTFLDLGSADVLERQLQHLISSVDELNQEAIKFNKYQNMCIKQYQDKSRWLQRRALENNARTSRGEEPLPDEDLNKVFKPIVAPSRLNPLVLSGQILAGSDHVSQFCSSSLGKWYATKGLQEAKNSNNE